MPNAGKTTLITHLCKHLTRQGHSVAIVREGTRDSKIRPKGSFHYNLHGIFISSSAILEGIHSSGIVLVDRGMYDRLVFFRTLYQRKHISKIEYHHLKEINKELMPLISHYFVHLCSPVISLGRDRRHARDGSGTVMNIPFLTSLYKNYQKVLSQQASKILDAEKNPIDRLQEFVLKSLDL